MVVELLLPVSQLVLFLGIAFFFGYTLSLLLERLGVPNVLVYILLGIIVGNFLSSYFSPGLLESESYHYWFLFVENIALGLIGFKIGTELELKLLSQHSRLIVILTLAQVIATFVLVFIGAMLFLGNLLISLIFAGLATATAPAATMEIIRKFKAKGPLTTRLQWVLAFDDVLAVLIVEAIIAYASIVLVGEVVTVLGFMKGIGQEIVLALVIGFVIGMLLDLIIEGMHAESKLEMMEISLGALIFAIGIAMSLHTSVILTTMTVGAVVVNREGDNYHDAGELLEIIMSPILIIFFVLVGAELNLSDLNPIPWFAVIYFVTRAIGKIYGTQYGAKLANASPEVEQNLGLGMLPQGGVALGLMTVASELYLSAGLPEWSNLLIITIVVSTVFSEGIGSFASLYALGRAGELAKSKVRDNPLVQRAIEDSDFVDSIDDLPDRDSADRLVKTRDKDEKNT